MAARPKTDGREPATGRSRNCIERERHDMVALGILVAAVILFVGTGSAALIEVIRSWTNGGAGGDALLANALILNIALVIFGWRRHADLAREVAERRKAEEAAQQLARTDALTGCLNRRSLDAGIADLLGRAAGSGESVVMMLIDLDRFKRSNDLHGHRAGDVVLSSVADRLRRCLPEHSVLARLGGDEFLCAVTCPADRPDDTEHLVDRINEAIARPIDVGGPAIEITASIGLAMAGPPYAALQDLGLVLMHRADLAMYQAKKAGRNRSCWFEPSMEKDLLFRSELERGIRAGITAGEFMPFYEKQVNLDTGELTGFEMLARWQPPGGASIPPDIFIPVAEEIGAICELSEMLIRQALIDAREWDPRLTLSVNISPVQLRDPWFAQKLLKLLVEVNFPPSRLDIEITETCLHENIGQVRSLITSLKNQGIRISLDDFGTGYSSLAQLRTLPFDRIKIDRSFVSTLASNKDSSAIIEAISSMGRGMNLPITAEGIESREVLDKLRTYGSFKGQGFLYGQPESAEAVRRMLAESNLLSGAAPQHPGRRATDHFTANR